MKHERASVQPRDLAWASAAVLAAIAHALPELRLTSLEQYSATYAVDLDANPPLPSSLRAILAQTATDLAGTDPTTNPDTGQQVQYGQGPDWATGYGLANAPEAVEQVEDQQLIENSLSPVDHTDEWTFSVSAGETVNRVTLAWDDRAGTPNADESSSKLVNDLDLVLIDPDGVEYDPLVLPLLTPNDCDGVGANGIQVGTCAGIDDPNQDYFGPAAPGIDRRNNLEQVVVSDAAGNANRRRSVGYWHNQYKKGGAQSVFDQDTLACYVEITRFASSVYDEERNLTSLADAEDALHGGGRTAIRLDRELLAVWLNFANGSIAWDEPFDTDATARPTLRSETPWPGPRP